MVKILYTFILTIFVLSQSVVAQCSGTPMVLNQASGTFSDGSLADYADNLDCYWLISPAGAGTISLTFTALDLEVYECSDKVRIYDGSDTLSNLIGTACGVTLPGTITSTGGTMLIRFTSDLSWAGAGWEVSYTSTTAPPVFCSGTTTLTAPSGNLNDGSGTSDYSNNADCIWLIEPVNASSITLSFSSFSTQGGLDFVKVYDNSNGMPSQIGSYSGSSIPSSLTLPGSAMMIQFTSNGSVTDLGWDASYTSVNFTGIADKDLNKSLTIYPNPFHQTAMIEFSVPETEACELVMYDIYGKSLKRVEIPAFTPSLVIDAKSLPNGMCFYSISKNNMLIHTGKVIVE